MHQVGQVDRDWQLPTKGHSVQTEPSHQDVAKGPPAPIRLGTNPWAVWLSLPLSTVSIPARLWMQMHLGRRCMSQAKP